MTGSDFGLGGNGTRLGAAAAAGSGISTGRPGLTGVCVASAWLIRRNCPTATPIAMMMRPPTTAVVPADDERVAEAEFIDRDAVSDHPDANHDDDGADNK